MSTVTRELITLQVGHYANFVGTHWWNLQEASFVYDSTKPTDLNHDFLFREGLTSQRQETYTPRVLCIDVQGSLHTLSARGSLYTPVYTNPSTSEAAWDGPVDLIHQLPQEKNQYLMDLEQEDARYSAPTDEDKDICLDDLSNTSVTKNDRVPSSQKIYDLSKSVRVWSDFLRPHFHPDAIYLLDSIMIQGARGAAEEGEEDLWSFPSGLAVYYSEKVEEEITDRIRQLAESCNSPQGFQVLSDVHNGMGGLSYGILQHISDEYGSKDSLTFATSPPHLQPATPQARTLTQAAIVQSYTELSQCSSVLVPLCLRQSIIDFEAPCCTFPGLTFQESNAYLSSSVLGAFLETASTVYRTRTAPLPVSVLADILTPGGRKVAGGSLVLPLDVSTSDETRLSKYLVPLSAGAALTPNLISQLRAIRGVLPATASRGESKVSWEPLFVQACDPLCTTPPFPPIYAHQHDAHTPAHTRHKNGKSTQETHQEVLRSVSSLGVLHQGASVGHTLRPLLTAAHKIDITKIPPLLEEGLDKETWMTLVENLRTLVLDYCLENEEMDCADED